jgi:hypothetical protein
MGEQMCRSDHGTRKVGRNHIPRALGLEALSILIFMLALLVGDYTG